MLVKNMIVKMNTIPKFGMKTKPVGGVNPSKKNIGQIEHLPRVELKKNDP